MLASGSVPFGTKLDLAVGDTRLLSSARALDDGSCILHGRRAQALTSERGTSYLLFLPFHTRPARSHSGLLDADASQLDVDAGRVQSKVAASPRRPLSSSGPASGAAAHVINAVLLTAVLSATNSCFYASSRMLLSMAREGHAPRIFGWVNGRGVPVPALL
ncbi:hypothetical protein NUW54_g8938 [Trametes sanguinea]|uniref:Uncharacterized protein n=1 Tax=Trametes sanguinea TaxID=158606 RepID=A0ACC1P9Q3_9APHY|nr:hypothetical protein NUW54_g8938 [Trametes sanguinea]